VLRAKVLNTRGLGNNKHTPYRQGRRRCAPQASGLRKLAIITWSKGSGAWGDSNASVPVPGAVGGPGGVVAGEWRLSGMDEPSITRHARTA